MTTKQPEPRSILVPIDLHGVNRHTLEILVHIARQLDRQLLGLLVEDSRLQQVADLPFTTEISLSSGQEKSLLRDHLSQRHSLVSADARRLLHELAQRYKVALSFEDVAGARWQSALQRDGQLDIFFPARQRGYDSGEHYASSVNAIKRLGVVLPQSQVDSNVTSVAATLVAAGLVGDIYILSNRPPLPEQLHDLYRQGHQVRLQTNFCCNAVNLGALIRQSQYDLLLIPRECLQEIPTELLEAALDKSSGQILVIN